MGIYLGSTGYTWISGSGSSSNAALTGWSEKLATHFLNHLLNDGMWTTAGKAYKAAVNEYVSDYGGVGNPHRRVLAIATLYGIPNYTWPRFVILIPYYPVGYWLQTVWVIWPYEAGNYIDATAAHSGALLGDVRHDPFQSAGLETPPHQLVEAGAIHRAHKGVLYIDEINTLNLPSQQHLLTAIQERKFQITGQSERSFGAMVKTEPVSCDFILVSAGNLDALKGMHPALRSRIRGYGYEIYLNSTMDDTDENREKLIRFVAQEVKKDGKIPHFKKLAVAETIHEAQRRAGRKGKLS